jgi:hypothetical protein
MSTTPHLLSVASRLAATGVPVLPLHVGKAPFGNCPDCTGNACGGRPNMKSAGPCRCPGVCHAWAAATTDPAVLTSPAWTARRPSRGDDARGALGLSRRHGVA